MVDAIDSKSILGCQGAGSSPVIGKLVLLDFDGLLVDTEKLHYLGYGEALKHRNLSLNINFSTYIALAHDASGSGFKDYLHELYPSLLFEELRKEKNALYLNHIEEGVSLMPFVPEFLLYLEKNHIPCAVVTNSGRKQVQAICACHAPLQKISLWFTREDYEKPKPHPDGYLKALSHFPHISPKDVTGFEDTLKGIEALKLAGVNPILICSEDHPQLLHKKEILHFPHLGHLIH